MDPETREKFESKGTEEAPASSRSAHAQGRPHEWMEQSSGQQDAAGQQAPTQQQAQGPVVQGPQGPVVLPPGSTTNGAAADLLKLLADILDRMNRGSDLSDAAKDAVTRYLALRSTLAHR